ncbi:MAG: hypothetical protein PHG04_01555 [Candidatus Nanoarchaeia archaeon]|nr:hypothetical protein [Candidatus Nanoarchaeia archaeon]MDD5054049.1 hypothetical protein [Candidatus Nanoarchaeia archaeon]
MERTGIVAGFSIYFEDLKKMVPQLKTYNFVNKAEVPGQMKIYVIEKDGIKYYMKVFLEDSLLSKAMIENTTTMIPTDFPDIESYHESLISKLKMEKREPEKRFAGNGEESFIDDFNDWDVLEKLLGWKK